MGHPVRADRGRARRPPRLPALRLRALLAGADRAGRAGPRPHRLRAAPRCLAGRRCPPPRPPRDRARGPRRRAVPRRPRRQRHPADAPPRRRRPAPRHRPHRAGAARLPAAQAGPRQPADRTDGRADRLLHRRAGHARLRPAGRRRHLVPHQLRPPRDGAGRKDAGALPPPRVRHGRLGQPARRLRPPRPARALARLGAGAPRPRPEPVRLRPDHRGAAVRRAVLRHGAAGRRPRAARVAGRPPLLEHLGAAAAALLLPLRRGGRPLRARQPRDARREAPTAKEVPI